MGIFPRRMARRRLVLVTAMAFGLSGCPEGGGDGGTPTTSTIIDIDQTMVSVSWAPNPPSENIQGYHVYFAKNGQSLSRISDTAAVAGFNPITPVVIYDAIFDLGLTESDSSICFGLQAYNVAGSSPMSETACKSL